MGMVGRHQHNKALDHHSPACDPRAKNVERYRNSDWRNGHKLQETGKDDRVVCAVCEDMFIQHRINTRNNTNANTQPYRHQGIDDIPNTQPNTDLPQKSTTNKNKEIKNIRKKNIFIHPTLAEVTAYCKERHNNVDPQTFIDFYESKGWMVGKNKMKDWKACVRTWEKSRKSGHVVIDPPDYIRTYSEEPLKEEDLPF